MPHKQLAQITALVLCSSFLGSSIGSAIAGGIYSGTFKTQLAEQLGSSASQTLIDGVYNSITGVLPVWGSVKRIAIDQAYSNVMAYFTYTALASSIPSFLFVWFLPNVILPDSHNTAEAPSIHRDEDVQE